ncbi:MAG: hypothetical protein K8R60_02140 [Burkholderiales bacterium]|nr:hypothetical protein [Burkholderiales bacterium]
MSAEDGQGLMTFWSSIEPENQLAFLRWHNCEHIPERVSTPGFLRGRRYRSTADSERFLMFYETEDEQVLSSPAYMARLNAPTRRTREALAWFRKSTRSVFRLAQTVGSRDVWPAPVLVVARFDAGDADDADAALGRVESLMTSGLFTRVRRYRAGGDRRSGSTNESAIHGAGTGSLNGLLMADSAELDLLDDAAAQIRLGEALAQALGPTTAAGAELETLALDFALDSPALRR